MAALALVPGLWGTLYGLRPVCRGVNDAGAHWGTPRRKGLRFSSDRTLQYIARQGLRIVRLPLSWESLQPELGGALDQRAVADLKRYVARAHGLGLRVILDPHNYARYTWRDRDGKEQVRVIGEAPLTIECFSRFWYLMAREFRDDPGIHAYGLMNEPNNMDTAVWKSASQAALLAIRRAGDRHLVFVPGCDYSACHRWLDCHGVDGWITDPARNFAYEAHCYFNRSSGGPYALSYAEEARLDPTLDARTLQRLNVFIRWCDENGVRGFIGEFGCPDDPDWLRHLDRFLARLDAVHMGATAWAVGDRWPEEYQKSMQPLDNYTRDRGQMVVLRRHAGGRTASPLADMRLGYVKAYWRAWWIGRHVRDRLRELRSTRSSAPLGVGACIPVAHMVAEATDQTPLGAGYDPRGRGGRRDCVLSRYPSI